MEIIAVCYVILFISGYYYVYLSKITIPAYGFYAYA